jgi:hypothetical protein
MRARVWTVAALAAAGAALAGCAGGSHGPQRAAPPARPDPAPPPARVVVRPAPDATVARLEVALMTNPNNVASAVRCRRATGADRRIATASFGGHPRRLFACAMIVGALPRATYDVMLLSGGCFVGHRRDAPVADYGCLRAR